MMNGSCLGVLLLDDLLYNGKKIESNHDKMQEFEGSQIASEEREWPII